ncbi:MAG: OmpA family protein [Longimicrobiales bacterium]|nr:OmpA family protein [Longimicrobiales bacterium]
MSLRTLQRGLGLVAAFAVVGATSACKTVSPDEMDASLAELRAEMLEEMAEGDAAIHSELEGDIDAVEARLAALEQDLAEMEREFQVSIQRLEGQLRFNVPVYFGFDDSTLESGDQEILDRFAAVASEYYPEALVTVEGFTDPAGSESYNLWLGEQRANAVAEYLTTNTAMSAERVRAVSYGEDTRRLINDQWGPGQEGWQNRRVVLAIDHNGAMPAMASDSDMESGR